MAAASGVQLCSDYARIGISGLKRLHGGFDDASRVTVARLVAAGLAVVDGDAFTLQRPEYAVVEIDPATQEVLRLIYTAWLQSGAGEGGDELLYGELGYWQHWWNMLHARSHDTAPLRMDLVTDASLATRGRPSETNAELLGEVLARRLVTGRLIVAPEASESSAEALVGIALAAGLEVRVLAGAGAFTVYDGSAAVLVEPADAGGDEGYRLTRRASIIAPLNTLFELHWSAAIPWRSHRQGVHGILHLLGNGWTDERIATALGVSPRTVSRRVSEVMAATGAASRFELGMRYARSNPAAP